MLSTFSAHADFLKAARPSLSADTFRKTAEQHVLQVSKSLRSVVSPPLSEAAATLDSIKESCLDEDLKAQLVDVVNNLATSLRPEVGAGHHCREILRPQEHFHMHRYMTEKDWMNLFDQNMSFNDETMISVYEQTNELHNHTM